jgi:hypothetical protein
MGWSVGWDTTWKRDVGYGVPAFCDDPDCSVEIDRGLAYVCGGAPFGGEHGCGLHFCPEHLMIGGPEQQCQRCITEARPYAPKADHPSWTAHKMTDDSWADWRRRRARDR